MLWKENARKGMR